MQLKVHKLVDDWMQTTDLWCRKRLLYQLRHNHCPTIRAVFIRLATAFSFLSPSSSKEIQLQNFADRWGIDIASQATLIDPLVAKIVILKNDLSTHNKTKQNKTDRIPQL